MGRLGKVPAISAPEPFGLAIIEFFWIGQSGLMIADYLKSQASRCLSLARTCFDLETARQLRLMADEFRAKADEMARSARRQSGSMQQQPMQQQQTKGEDE